LWLLLQRPSPAWPSYLMSTLWSVQARQVRSTTPCLSLHTSLIHPSIGSAGPNGYVYSSPGVYHSKPKVNAGAIAGGVVGSLAVLAIAVVALYWIRRRYPRRGHVETEALPAPPQYNMPPPNANALEQPAYVYKSEELGANEGLSANEGFGAKEGRKHVEAWPAGKKM
jgi:hypothetical protein